MAMRTGDTPEEDLHYVFLLTFDLCQCMSDLSLQHVPILLHFRLKEMSLYFWYALLTASQTQTFN